MWRYRKAVSKQPVTPTSCLGQSSYFSVGLLFIFHFLLPLLHRSKALSLLETFRIRGLAFCGPEGSLGRMPVFAY